MCHIYLVSNQPGEVEQTWDMKLEHQDTSPDSTFY